MHLTTVTVSDKGQISIPKRLRKHLGIKKGDELVLIEDHGQMILEPSSRVAKKLRLMKHGESVATMMASEKTLAKDWSEPEDERWNHV